MRGTFLPLAVLALCAAVASTAEAQEIGDELTLTGCLAQEQDEGETPEYLLEHVTGLTPAPEEIELFADEGVSFAEHVGHTVEVTGVVVADDDEEAEVEESEEPEEPEEEASELHIRVTELSHVATSCQGGA